jgi:hypothetical protein
VSPPRPVVLQFDTQDADVEELDNALRVLSSELLSAPDLDVEQRSEPAPPNSKGIGALAALAIHLLDSKAAASAITVLGDFLTRHKHLTLRVKQGETVIELSGSNPKLLAAMLPQVAAALMNAQRG